MAVMDLYTWSKMEQNLFSILKSRIAGTSLKLVAASGKKGQALKRKRHAEGFGHLTNCVSYCIHLFSVGCACVAWPTCGDQRTTCWSCCSASALWVLGIKLRLSELKQTPLPTKPSCQPFKCLFNNVLNRSCKYLYVRWKDPEAEAHSSLIQRSTGKSKVRKGSQEEPLELAGRRTGGRRFGSQSSALKSGVVCVCVHALAPGLDCPLPHLCAEVTLGDPHEAVVAKWGGAKLPGSSVSLGGEL